MANMVKMGPVYVCIFGYKQQKLSYNSSQKGKLAIRPQRCFQAIQGIKLVGLQRMARAQNQRSLLFMLLFYGFCLCFVFPANWLPLLFILWSLLLSATLMERVWHFHSKHQRKVLWPGLGQILWCISWRPWMVGNWSLLPKMSVRGPVLGEGTVRGVFWAERDCKRCLLQEVQ